MSSSHENKGVIIIEIHSRKAEEEKRKDRITKERVLLICDFSNLGGAVSMD